MPEPIPFREANTDFVAGESGAAFELPACRAVDEHGRPWIVSKWRLTTAELARLANNGGVLFVCLLSASQPPISLHLDFPLDLDGPDRPVPTDEEAGGD